MSKRFKIGDLVTVNSTNTGIRKDETVQKFGLEMGQEVRLIRYDPQDETWLVQGKDGSWPAVWIKRRYLKPLEAEEPKPVEAPKPAEAKKPRLMLCVNMSDSPADYTVGKVYELKSEDEQYYYFKRNDGGVRGSLGGMFKHRFIELKDGVENSVKVLCINNSGGYRDLLTVGKTYEAVPSIDGEDFWTIPVSDKGTQATAYKHRFTVLTDETAKREWKVGDTLLSSFLNDPNIEKEFHGYDKGWNIYTERCFMSDRKLEVIQEREGKIGARISGTMDIWITLESLEKHP